MTGEMILFAEPDYAVAQGCHSSETEYDSSKTRLFTLEGRNTEDKQEKNGYCAIHSAEDKSIKCGIALTGLQAFRNTGRKGPEWFIGIEIVRAAHFRLIKPRIYLL